MVARILIVDDNPMNLKLARLLVLSLGHVAEVADGAVSALHRLEDLIPDAILVDLQMPDIDGLELTRRLKGDPRTAHIPVVALTAAAMAGDRERALAAGCDGFIPKPLDTRRFGEDLAPFLSERAA
jgi:CheY-like chemotaxis protein